MFRRQTTGSVVCVSCGYLVGVNDAQCYHCGRRNPGLWGFAQAFRQLGHDMGFVPFMVGTCGVVYLLTLLWTVMAGGSLFGASPLAWLSPSGVQFLGASGAGPVFGAGMWWTLLSASWLHGGLLHIVFNVMWIRQLAPAVADFYGPGRMVIVYTVGGILGFLLSSIAGIGITVGASASIFGLLGALVYYGRRSGSSLVHGQAMSWALTMFALGFIMPGVDNFAHAGGFAGGYLAGRVLDPLKPERIDHLVIGVGCLAASLLAVAFSLVRGFMLLMTR
jgi:rhomboid protease GluP